MRGFERDELLKRPVLQRFLDCEEKAVEQAGKGPMVLVSTSAGEVGFDLNADHMVCDAAPLDSMIQRLGRVNRRGYGVATVRMFAAKPEKDSQGRREKSSGKKHTYESAAALALESLRGLPVSPDGARDASPKALDGLRKKLTPEQLEEASAPKPVIAKLTDILLDAWSMTTIVKPMPGRPPVAEWLRGIGAEEPDTTIAWRAELDIEGFGELEVEDIEEWFGAHRVLPHETLSVPTREAAKWLLERWNHLNAELPVGMAERPCVIERGGLEVVQLRVLLDELRVNKPEATKIAGASIILPAAFGGIQGGLLDESAPPMSAAGKDEAASADPLKAASDVADERAERCRLLRTESEDEPLTRSCDATGLTELELDLPCEGDTWRRLVSCVPKRQRPDFGTTRQWLRDHVDSVQTHASDLCNRLGLSGSVREAVELAAKWHDRGKQRDIWQIAVGRKPGEPELGKSGGSMKRVPGGYRHEFGSLREFAEEQEGKVSEDVFELAMHLIAAHHGRGRPHFPNGGFDPEARAKSPRLAAEVIRRFARLQRQYGHWRLAWLENLLRCADAMASAGK